jgi:hypothetical protein
VTRCRRSAIAITSWLVGLSVTEASPTKNPAAQRKAAPAPAGRSELPDQVDGSVASRPPPPEWSSSPMNTTSVMIAENVDLHRSVVRAGSDRRRRRLLASLDAGRGLEEARWTSSAHWLVG